MTSSILVGKGQVPVAISLRMANRHGLVAGATGTGKTVTLQRLAEQFSRAQFRGQFTQFGICNQRGDK
jgi:uncharacterized protein